MHWTCFPCTLTPQVPLPQEQGYLHSTHKSLPSIFADVSIKTAQQAGNSHIINMSGGPAYNVHAAAAWLTNDDEALFALATNLGSILLVKMPPYRIQGGQQGVLCW